jgi:hypothetical protein
MSGNALSPAPLEKLQPSADGDIIRTPGAGIQNAIAGTVHTKEVFGVYSSPLDSA